MQDSWACSRPAGFGTGLLQSLRMALSALSEFRLIPRLETFPAVVFFAQTTLGRIIVLAAFGLGMRFFLPNLVSTLLLTFVLALTTFIPENRHFILAVVPILLVVMRNFKDPLLLGLNLSVMALGIFLYLGAIRWPKSWFGQRPVAFF